MTKKYVSPLVYRPEETKNLYMIHREREVLKRVMMGEVELIPQRDKRPVVFRPFHAQFTKAQEEKVRTLIKRVWGCVRDIKRKITQDTTIKEIVTLIHDWFEEHEYPRPPQGVTEPLSSDLFKDYIRGDVTPYVRLRPSYNVQEIVTDTKFLVPNSLPFPAIGRVNVAHIHLPYEPRSILLLLLEDGAVSAFFERPTHSLKKVKEGYQCVVGFTNDGATYADTVVRSEVQPFPETLLSYPSEYIELLHKRDEVTEVEGRIALSRKINAVERRVARRLSLQLTEHVMCLTLFNPPVPKEFKHRPISIEDRFHTLQCHLVKCLTYHTLRKGGEVYFSKGNQLVQLTGTNK